MGMAAYIWFIMLIFHYFKERKGHKQRKQWIKMSFDSLPAFRDTFLIQEDYRHNLYNRMLFAEEMLANVIIYLYL